MTIDDLRKNGLIIYECISGSRAYGLDNPDSDTDIKGVYILPEETYYGLNYIPQVNNSTNDIVFYELKRFLELLSVNNPNILELLNTPSESILYKHPLWDMIESKGILSKQCQNSFGKFACSQIKKAKGLNKKILNPMDKERKSILDFCFVNHQQGSIPVLNYLEIQNWKAEDCGLVKLNNMRDTYSLYHSVSIPYNGLIKGKDSKDIQLSSVPKEAIPYAILHCNKDGYSKYCKDYKAYWDWVDKRNESRYESTKSHGKNYDAKNMMHVFRLMEMAIEIANQEEVIVKRPDRDFLLEVKSGKYTYEELLAIANKKQSQMEAAYSQSKLPDQADMVLINGYAYSMRKAFYQEREKNENMGT